MKNNFILYYMPFSSYRDFNAMTLIITKPRLDSFTAALNGIAKILTI